METTNILDNISVACTCSMDEAQEHLDNELRHLRELVGFGDLRVTDISTSCSNLGLDADSQVYFIDQLTVA